MIALLLDTWWLWFLFVGVMMFVIGFPPTVRLLFTGRWANWSFIFALALTGLGILNMSSAAVYVYIQPTEELLVDIPEPPPPAPGEFASMVTFAGVYAALANIMIMFIKPPTGYFFLAVLGVLCIQVVFDAIAPKKRRKRR